MLLSGDKLLEGEECHSLRGLDHGGHGSWRSLENNVSDTEPLFLQRQILLDPPFQPVNRAQGKAGGGLGKRATDTAAETGPPVSRTRPERFRRESPPGSLGQ
jgi:hypothetical protein